VVPSDGEAVVELVEKQGFVVHRTWVSLREQGVRAVLEEVLRAGVALPHY
jgi:hypothetical protein